MGKLCHSGAAPLGTPDFKGPAENYCKYCTDAAGKLKSPEEIQNGIAQWFKGWQPNLDDKKTLERAGFYMKSMPAWAEE